MIVFINMNTKLRFSRGESLKRREENHLRLRIGLFSVKLHAGSQNNRWNTELVTKTEVLEQPLLIIL